MIDDWHPPAVKAFYETDAALQRAEQEIERLKREADPTASPRDESDERNRTPAS